MGRQETGGNSAHTETIPQKRLHSARGTLARKSPAGAGLSSSKRGLPLGGKPTNAKAQFCTSMSRLAGHLCLPTQRAVTHSTKVTSKPAQSTGRLTLGCTARGRSQKKPRRSGAKFLAGVCPSRGKANPPIHYHSWLRSGDFAEKPRQRQKKPRQRQRGLVGPDCLMRAAAERPNRQRQAHFPNAQPHHRLHAARGTPA